MLQWASFCLSDPVGELARLLFGVEKVGIIVSSLDMGRLTLVVAHLLFAKAQFLFVFLSTMVALKSTFGKPRREYNCVV